MGGKVATVLFLFFFLAATFKEGWSDTLVNGTSGSIKEISQNFESANLNLTKGKMVRGMYVPERYIVEKDSEGFLKSFSLSQLEEANKFLEDFGFVVIDGVLTKEECNATIDEIWEVVKEQTQGKMDRNDASTWDELVVTPNSGMIGPSGILKKQFVLNRV